MTEDESGQTGECNRLVQYKVELREWLIRFQISTTENLLSTDCHYCYIFLLDETFLLVCDNGIISFYKCMNKGELYEHIKPGGDVFAFTSLPPKSV